MTNPEAEIRTLRPENNKKKQTGGIIWTASSLIFMSLATAGMTLHRRTRKTRAEKIKENNDETDIGENVGRGRTVSVPKRRNPRIHYFTEHGQAHHFYDEAVLPGDPGYDE